tara:strand:- start:2190 stop:3242 length:1053 start_codon:yes stop_codon:yes gene_type:complete
MKLKEFYKNLYEEHGERRRPNPKDYREGERDPNYLHDKEQWILRFGHEEKDELKNKKEKEELLNKERITPQWEKQVRGEVERKGCKYLTLKMKELQERLKKLERMGDIGVVAIEHVHKKLSFIKSLPESKKCFDRTEEPKVKDKTSTVPTPRTITNKDGSVTQPTLDTTVKGQETIVVEPGSREEYYKNAYDQPNIIPQSLYSKESEVGDMGTVQSNELIDDLTINIETQILRQEPEIQEKLKEYNINAEKISKLVPLTLETKDFMMNLDMEGVKLPLLMLLYENVESLYPAIKNNQEIDPRKLKRLSKVINYNDFWDWVKSLWEKAPNYLRKKGIGIIPEFGDKFTVFP